MNGAASGHYFENYVVAELLKNYAYAKSKANLTYYRDANAKEIDVIVEEGNRVHPLEIKKSASPDRREVKNTPSLISSPLKEEGAALSVCAKRSFLSTPKIVSSHVI